MMKRYYPAFTSAIVLSTVCALAFLARVSLAADLIPHSSIVHTLDLNKWQDALIDGQGLTKTKICFVIPEDASIETSRALAIIACSLGSDVNSQNIEFIDNPKEAQNIIVVGTGQELGTYIDTSGKKISTDAGVLELFRDPNHSEKVTLYVTGGSPAAVLKAAIALTNQNSSFHQNLSKNQSEPLSYAIVKEFPTANIDKKSYSNRLHYMPHTKSFTLKDLGYQTMSMHGVDPEHLTIQFNTAPGIAFLGPAPRLYIVYGYSAQLNPERSTLDVSLNDVPIGSFPLTEQDGDVRCDIDCTLPVKLIGPRNKLDFVFNFVPGEIDKSKPLTNDQLSGTLYEDTWLEIDRENLDKLPDLSLFKYDGYPLLEDRSLKDLAIVLPSRRSIDVLSGLTKFAFLLGQRGALPAGQVQIFDDNDLPNDIRDSHHLVIFSPEKDSSIIETKLSHNLSHNQPDYGMVQEILSPWAASKVIMVISASSPQWFQYALAGVLDPNVRDKLTGSACTISPQLTVEGTTVGEQRIISTIAPWRYAALILSSHVWLAPLLVILFVISATFSLESFLDRKRAKR